MKSGLLLGVLFLSVLFAAPALPAEPGATAAREIEFLLTAVGGSGCEFYRNGLWYDSHRAEQHLRSKYGMESLPGNLTTAEAFIERVATSSSLSGIAYAIRCNGAAEMPAARWFRDQLSAYRARGAAGAPDGREPPRSQAW